jgi:hypothetical protein
MSLFYPHSASLENMRQRDESEWKEEKHENFNHTQQEPFIEQQ